MQNLKAELVELVATSLDKLPTMAELTVMENMLTDLMPWSVSFMGNGLPKNLETLKFFVKGRFLADEKSEVTCDLREEGLTESPPSSPSLLSGHYCQSRHN